MKYYVKTRLIGRLQALIGRQALIGQIIGRSGLEGEENEEEVIDDNNNPIRVNGKYQRKPIKKSNSYFSKIIIIR